jgi:molybdopterin converting factor small subunit
MHRVRRENRSPNVVRTSTADPEKLKLLEELNRAKENLNMVVQEIIFTENQLTLRDQEIVTLKSKLAKHNEQDQASLKSLSEKNRILETALQSKDKVYNDMIDDLKRKAENLQTQLDQKATSEYQSKSEKVVDRLSVVLQKENLELKKLLSETKDQMAAQEQNFQHQTQQTENEKQALEEQLKVFVTNNLTHQEKQQLAQSICAKPQNSEDRLSQSLSITNTVKLLGHSKEKVKFLETENANLRSALVEVGKDYEREKEDWDRQMNDLRRVIYDLNNKIKESETSTIFEYLEELKRENIMLRNSIAQSQTVSGTSNLELARNALHQESRRLDEMMSTPQYILSSMIAKDANRIEEEEDLQEERNMVYELQIQNQKLKDEKELLYVRIQDLEYHAAVLDNQRLDLQQDVLQLAKQRDRFHIESVLQQRRTETTPTKGILKSDPTTPKYYDAVNRVNNLLKKVRKIKNLAYALGLLLTNINEEYLQFIIHLANTHLPKLVNLNSTSNERTVSMKATDASLTRASDSPEDWFDLRQW